MGNRIDRRYILVIIAAYAIYTLLVLLDMDLMTELVPRRMSHCVMSGTLQVAEPSSNTLCRRP